MFSSRNCNNLANGQCAPLPRRTMHHKLQAVSVIHKVVVAQQELLHSIFIGKFYFPLKERVGNSKGLSEKRLVMQL